MNFAEALDKVKSNARQQINHDTAICLTPNLDGQVKKALETRVAYLKSVMADIELYEEDYKRDPDTEGVSKLNAVKKLALYSMFVAWDVDRTHAWDVACTIMQMMTPIILPSETVR